MKARTRTMAAAVLLLAGCAGRGVPVGRRAESRELRLERAYRELEAGLWREAVGTLGTLIDETPGDPRLRMDRGYALQSLGEPAAAADEFEVVLREPNEHHDEARAALEVLRSERSEEGRAHRQQSLLDEGYDALRVGDKARARRRFEEALSADPTKTEIAKQLGYMSAEEGDLKSAAARFEGVRLLSPEDHASLLELGYFYAGLREQGKAERAFLDAVKSPDPDVRDRARRALENVADSRRRVSLDLFASPFYATRFENKILFLEGELGWRPKIHWPLVLYLAARASRDSRSSDSGDEPRIFADNVIGAGPGVRYQPRGRTWSLSAEMSREWNLERTPEHPRSSEWNGRVVAADNRYWAGPWWPSRVFTEAGASVGWYDRQRGNVIGYGQLRHGVRLYEGVWRLAAYLPANLVKDGNRDFYNNLVEGGAGVELQPWTAIGLNLRAEYLRGRYMGISGRDPNPYARDYDDFRVMLLYGFRISSRAPDEAEWEKTRPMRRSRILW